MELVAKKSRLFVTYESGGQVEIGELGNIECDSLYTDDIPCIDGRETLSLSTTEEVKFEARGYIGIYNHRFWLRVLGVGNGTNNWLKVRGGTMDREQQIIKAMKMLRRKYAW